MFSLISSMAYNLNKSPQQRPKTNRFLACFGITSKTASKSDKKCNKSGGSGSESRWFKLRMPRIKIIVINKRRKGKGKGNFDAKTVDLKAACQSIIKLEATKIQHAKIDHGLITQEVTKNTNPVQSEEPANRKQTPIPTVKRRYVGDKVTKDSLLGVSMMVIMLIIMTFWGYLCAIICMSAWLYCVPLLRMYKDGSRPNVIGSLKAMIEGVVQRDDDGISVS